MCTKCVLYDVLLLYRLFFFFKQKTAYEMRISDWSSDVCSSDLILHDARCLGDDRKRERIPLGQAIARLHLVAVLVRQHGTIGHLVDFALATFRIEIGRASCRERVCQYV